MGKRKSKGYRLPSGEYVTGAVEVTAPKMSNYEKRVKASGKRSKDYRNMGSQIAEGFGMIPGGWGQDSLIENLLETVPYLGQALSIDDAMLATQDLLKNNEQGYINNALDVLGVTPVFKYGKLTTPGFDKALKNLKKSTGKLPKGLDAAKDLIQYSPTLTTAGVTTYGVGKDIVDDKNIKANGGTINNNMKKKNKKLPIDNGLPKAYWGAILNTMLPQIMGAGAGAMTGATAGMATGAGSRLSGLGAGASTMGATGAGNGLGNMDVNNQTQVSLGKFGKGLKTAGEGLSGPLGPLAQATTKSVMDLVNAITTPEKNYRNTFENIGAHYANGGEIKIKPSKRGTFTKAAKQRGMGVQQFASKVLANKDNYSPAMVKKANFARNAAKWKKAMGGLVEPEIFDMGGFTGNYMDMFDYMALGGMTGGPGDPPKRLPSLNKELYQASAAELIGGPIQNFANYHPEDINRVKLGYYKSGQEYQDAFNKLEDAYANYGALTDEDRQRVKQENPDIFNPLMKSYNSAKFYQCDGCYGSSDIQPKGYKEIAHPVTGRKINVAEFDRPILKRTTTITDNRTNVLPEEEYKIYDRLTEEGFGVDKRTGNLITNREEYMNAYKSGNLERVPFKDKSASEKRASLKNLDLANLPKNAYGGEIDLYMALGGMMGGDNPIIPPTASDSLAVYNSAINLENQMKNLGYQKQGTFDMFNAYDQFINTGEFGLTNGKLKVKAPNKKLEQVKLTGTAAAKNPNAQVKDVGEFYSNKKIDDYKYNVAELLSLLGYNTDLPYQVLDERIAPQGAAKYTLNNPLNPKAEDAAIMLSYDPVAVKPYAMRTPEEQAEVERKYGKPIPVVEPKRIVPVTDLRRDSKDYLRTLENLDDKNTFIEYLRSGVDANEVRNLAPIEIQRRANAWKRGMGYGGMVDPLMAFGGMIDPTMAMQQMMYGSYAQGGQVPQNIPVEVEGEEMYEMPNGETGEFSGPKHENGGIPIALPEGTKIYSDRLKVNGKTMAQRKDKREANINKLEKLLTKNPNDKFIKEALKRQQETAALEEQQDMAMQEQANQEQQMQEMAMEEMLMGAGMQDMQQGMMAMGGMIKRADGSYSQRGLWDNIRANRGSGKKPTKEMLKQEKKIRAAEKAYGGMIKYADGGKIPQNILRSRLESHMSPEEANSYLNKYQGGTGDNGVYPNAFNQMQNPNLLGMDLGLMGGFSDYTSPRPDLYNDQTFTGISDAMDIAPYNFYRDFQTLPSAKATSIPTSGYTPTLNYSGIEVPSQQPNTTTIPIQTINLRSNYTPSFENPFSASASKTTPKTTTETEDEKDFTYTEGDKTGMTGTAIGMYGPAMMTLMNRLETPPNVNFYNTYGQDALRTQMEAEGIAGQSKDEAYRKNLMRANALRKQLANSARGVADMRTGQLTAALAEQEGARDILGSYLQSMAGLKGQRANLQAQIDQTRMGGEYQRDLADRQDIDQFYTNLAQNITGVSEGMQKMGRDKNIAKRNEDILSLSKNFSAYGLYVGKDKKGNLVLKDQNSDKELSEKETEEIIKKAKKEKGER